MQKMKETDGIPLDKKVADILDRIHSLGLTRSLSLRQDKIYVNTQTGVFYKGGFDELGNHSGQAMFYFSKPRHLDRCPVVLETHFTTGHEIIFQKSLIIFNDLSYYIGQVRMNQHDEPEPSGRGVLVNKQMIYEGTFQNGQPHGVGQVVTPGYRYYGEIDRSQLKGRCLERTKDGLFHGTININGRHGRLLTRSNTQQEINQVGQ